MKNKTKQILQYLSVFFMIFKKSWSSEDGFYDPCELEMGQSPGRVWAEITRMGSGFFYEAYLMTEKRLVWVWKRRVLPSCCYLLWLLLIYLMTKKWIETLRASEKLTNSCNSQQIPDVLTEPILVIAYWAEKRPFQKPSNKHKAIRNKKKGAKKSLKY